MLKRISGNIIFSLSVATCCLHVNCYQGLLNLTLDFSHWAKYQLTLKLIMDFFLGSGAYCDTCFAHSMWVFYSRLQINFDIKSFIIACSIVEQSALFYLFYILLSFFMRRSVFLFYIWHITPHDLELETVDVYCYICYMRLPPPTPQPEQEILGSQIVCLPSIHLFTLYFFLINVIWSENNFCIKTMLYNLSSNILLLNVVCSFFVWIFKMAVKQKKNNVQLFPQIKTNPNISFIQSENSNN